MLAFFASAGYGQVFKIELNQPDPLSIASGNDTTICPGHSISLGAETTAWGGSGEYLYTWFPIDGLDDPTSANPTATPEESTQYILTVVDANGCQITDSINVTIDLCLGIENRNLLQEMVIYPNPSSGRITLSGLPSNTGDLKVSLMNSAGIEVLYSEFEAGMASIDLDLDSLVLPRGVYIIRILVDDEVVLRRIQLI